MSLHNISQMASIAAGVDESAKTIKEMQPPVKVQGENADDTRIPFTASIKNFTKKCIKATGLWPTEEVARP
jgi:hypothetical protein